MLNNCGRVLLQQLFGDLDGVQGGAFNELGPADPEAAAVVQRAILTKAADGRRPLLPPNPTWSPLSTNTLTNGPSYFTDPEWPNYPARLYWLRSP